MTPYQHHFPYFLDLSKLNEDLLPLHVQARVKKINEKQEVLTIGKIDKYNQVQTFKMLIEFDHGHFLMISGFYLIAWYKQNGGFVVKQYNLQSPEPLTGKKEEFVDVHALNVGVNPHITSLNYDRFVTFIRIENLHKKEVWHESYGIVLLHEQQITIIPFDQFNESGGDPLYQWPALAMWDWENGKLHGLGMRMGSFTVDFRVAT